MKILFITRKFPPSTGGMELLAFDLSNALAAKTDLKLIKWGHKGRLMAVLVALPYLFIKSFIALTRGGIDVIHVQDGLLAPTGFILSRLFRKPFVVVIHGLDITFANPLFKIIVPAAVSRADAVVCISRAAADEAIKRGVPESKIRIIPLAVTDNIYKKSSRGELFKLLDLPEGSQILLTVGRLVKRKGVAWFIDNVLPQIAASHPEIIYLVAGEGEDRPNIEKAITRRHLENNVKLLGRTSDELLWAAYNGSDIFVMPNIKVPGDMEGFGLVLLEATLCELPVVASALEGIEDAVQNGKNGILVRSEDAASFDKNVSLLISDKAYAKSFGESSRRYTLETFQIDNVADKYTKVYDQLKDKL